MYDGKEIKLPKLQKHGKIDYVHKIFSCRFCKAEMNLCCVKVYFIVNSLCNKHYIRGYEISFHQTPNVQF